MSAFEEFSESAVLYARNAALVDEMKRRLDSDLDAFMEAVRSEVAAGVSPHTLRSESTQGYGYWFLSESEDGHREDHPLLWFDLRQVSLVEPGRFGASGCWPRGSEAQLAALADVAGDVAVSHWCKRSKGGKWSAFKVEIDFPQEGAVSLLAEAAVEILRAMEGCDRGLASG